MNPKDNDEERLIRIEQMLKFIAVKGDGTVAEAAPSLASPASPPAPPNTARKN